MGVNVFDFNRANAISYTKPNKKFGFTLGPDLIKVGFFIRFARSLILVNLS